MNNNTHLDRPSSALIIGSGGQDGSYLAELLESQGTRVIRIGREFFPHPESFDDYKEIALTRSGLNGKVLNSSYFKNLSDLINLEKPFVIFHLAAHHASSGIHLGTELDLKKMWLTSVGITATALETVFANKIQARVVVAGTSQMYSVVDTDLYVNEETPMRPQNYYAKTKSDSRKVINIYRELDPSIGQMAILFNHESPRRGPGFISTDIVTQIAQVIEGRSQEVEFRNPFARIDLTDARDVVSALSRMPQAGATDLVIGSSEAVSVFDLVQRVLTIFGLEKIGIKAIDKNLRDSVSSTLIADISKAKAHLDWNPTRDITETIVEMVKTKIEQK